jgi:hypothetical protein
MSEEGPDRRRSDQRNTAVFVVGSALAFLIIAAAAVYVLVRPLV